MTASRLRPLFVVIIALVLLAVMAYRFDVLPTPLQTPHVLAIEPLNGAHEVLPSNPLTITFSTPMDRIPTVNGIQITPPVRGEFVWGDDQTMTFIPETRFPISTTVTVNISQVARSQFQRALATEVTSRFTTISRPTVVNSSPTRDAQFVYVPDHVSIEFSRAMEPSMLGDTMQIDPKPEGFLFDVQGNVLTLHGYFKPQQRYQVTIPAEAIDAENGVELGSAYGLNFLVVSQYPNFSILNRDRVFRFPASAPIQLPVQFANVSRLDVEIYPLTAQEYETQASAPFEKWYEFAPSVRATQTMTVFTNAEVDRYTQQTVAVGILPAGQYYLKITTPEGVGDRQLLVVE
jgi:hypothetical protein